MAMNANVLVTLSYVLCLAFSLVPFLAFLQPVIPTVILALRFRIIMVNLAFQEC